MKNLVKGYDNEYSAPEIIISQNMGDVIMDSNQAVNDVNDNSSGNQMLG